MNGHSAKRRRRSSAILIAVVAAAVLAALCGAVLARLGTERLSPKEICLRNAELLAKAMRLYSSDYNDCLFFGHGDAFSSPLAAGQAGQTPYLKDALRRYLPTADERVWYCPSDAFAGRDYSTDPRWFGSFTYREAGAGYAAVAHAADRDDGIRGLRDALLSAYGDDEMRVDHAFSSYRFFPAFAGEIESGSPTVYVDVVRRRFARNWGAYGYWDIHPSVAPLFEEDLPFHVHGQGGPWGRRLLGRVTAFRDGHAAFQTLDMRGVNKYGDEDDALARTEGEPLDTARTYFAHLREGRVNEAKHLTAFESPEVQAEWQKQADAYAQRLAAGGMKWWGDAVSCEVISGPPPGEWAVVEVQWRRLANAGWIMDEHCTYVMRTINDEWRMVMSKAMVVRDIPFCPRP